MSKKVRVFQEVSTTIELDSNGFHEIAFPKYLECIQSLSSFLIEQFSNYSYSKLNESQKKEAKQVLSVICDCSDRANSLLNLEGDLKSSTIKKNVPEIDNLRSIENSFDPYASISSASSTKSDSIDYYRSPKDPPHSSQANSSFRCRSPAFAKMDKENTLLFKKYQMRMEYAKDKSTRQNLELELQRGIAENLMIAQARQAQIVKHQQEERLAAVEITMKNLPFCTTKEEIERKELYIEVLKHESLEPNISDVNFASSGLSSIEIVELIYQRTLRCSNHPLTQWLIRIQIKLKNRLLLLLKDFSDYIPLLPGAIDEKSKLNQIMFPVRNDIRLWELRTSVEEVVQDLRNFMDTVVAVLYMVYREQLSDESETLAYRLTESFLIKPLWPFFISIVRITNLESELRIADTIQSCGEDMREFGISSEVCSQQLALYNYCIQQIKKLPSLYSLVDKLSVLVHVSQKICENAPMFADSTGKLFGADELVPILSYVLVQSGLPQIVSECRTLDLLIHPKYMLGEEGYALTSFQTALNYLEMKKLISPARHNRPENDIEGTNLAGTSGISKYNG